MIGDKIWLVVLYIFPRWQVCEVDSLGLFGGLMAFWYPKFVNFIAHKSFPGILLFSFIRGSKDRFNILNTYAPYSSRIYFLDKLESCSLLKMGSLI